LRNARTAGLPGTANCYAPQVPANSPNPWTTERLNDAFDTLREDVGELRSDIRVIAPLVGTVSGLEQRANALARDVDKVELAVQKYVNKSVTRQLIIVSTPLFLASFTFIVAVLAGVKVG
jgi:hypothetical protein